MLWHLKVHGIHILADSHRMRDFCTRLEHLDLCLIIIIKYWVKWPVMLCTAKSDKCTMSCLRIWRTRLWNLGAWDPMALITLSYTKLEIACSPRGFVLCTGMGVSCWIHFTSKYKVNMAWGAIFSTFTDQRNIIVVIDPSFALEAAK